MERFEEVTSHNRRKQSLNDKLNMNHLTKHEYEKLLANIESHTTL